MMLDRRELLLAGVAGINQLGRHAQPRVTPPQLLRQSGAPAVGGAIVRAKGAPDVSVLGARRSARGEPVTLDDLWLIGSNTEAMTAVLYARLVENGRAHWNARLTDLFADLKPDPGWADVTIEDVMAHRAGVGDADSLGDRLAEFAKDARPLPEQRSEIAKLVLTAPPPGQRDEYRPSDIGYVLVGAAIERAAKTDWETAIAGEVFTPLELTSAGFGAPTGREPWGHVIANGRATPVPPSKSADLPPAFAPSVGVHLSLPDYAQFLRLFLTDGGGYLAAQTLARLADPDTQSGNGPALGWLVSAERGWAGGPVLAQTAGGSAWAADAQVAPAKGLAVVSVCNAGGIVGRSVVQRMSLSLIQQIAPT